MIELDEEDEAAVRQMLLQRRKAVKRLSDDDAASAANTQAALRGAQEMADLQHKGVNGASAQVRGTGCSAGRFESCCILLHHVRQGSRGIRRGLPCHNRDKQGGCYAQRSLLFPARSRMQCCARAAFIRVQKAGELPRAGNNVVTACVSDAGLAGQGCWACWQVIILQHNNSGEAAHRGAQEVM